MRVTFRFKLLLIAGAALFALVGVLGASAWIGVLQMRQLSDVEQRLVPKLEVGPRLESAFERLTRALQDAVAAQDPAALEATLEAKTKLFELISAAGPGLDPRDVDALRSSIADYYELARNISQRMIAGETGEALINDVRSMQTRQQVATAAIQKATVLGHGDLAGAFAAVRVAEHRGERLRLVIGCGGLLLVALLSVWVGRSMFQVLANLSSGFSRFATGDFGHAIPVLTHDELGDVSKEANQMAASLRSLAEQRDHDDWLKAGQTGLADVLRGELKPEEVVRRALSFLCLQINALAAAVYLREDDGILRLSGQYAGDALLPAPETLTDPALNPPGLGMVRSFREGEGLVGQVFLGTDALVVETPPSGYLTIRSGLGHSQPRALVLAPLSHFGRKIGVLEFALLTASSAKVTELLLVTRPILVSALEAAKSAAALRSLLSETQAQAQRLAAQEEELRIRNQELLNQQVELQGANLELEGQRRVLGQQNDDLERSARELHEKAAELSRVSSYKSQFLANMSHELRTPLNSMLLLSHLLTENEGGNLSVRQVEHVKTIHSAGQDLLSLINQVLDLSKIESGKQEIDLEPVELGQLTDKVRRVFEPLAQQKSLALVIETQAGLPATFTTDRQRVEGILKNLISNAIKFTDSGEVSVRIERPLEDARLMDHGLTRGAAIAFRVRDTGMGIAQEAQERVFAPFEQVDGRADRRHAGTGLGLAIARESALLLGGALWLESEPGRGSTFTCVLPERPAALIPRPSGVSSAPIDDRSSLLPDEPYLLIVEDDRVLTEQLIEIIHARRLKAVAVGSGAAALAFAKQHQPRGIILDVRLPDVDGWTVMESLKRDPETRSIPVHFVSGVNAPLRGLGLGAVGYLVKPATHAELSGVVRALSPAKSASQRVLVVEDDATHAQTLVALLRKEDFEVEHAASAQSALDHLALGAFGCMVLDLGLPDMDGLGLLEKLRNSPDLGIPRVVIHTGRSLTKTETRELETYAEAVVQKDGRSGSLLVEELRRFVHQIQDSVTESQAASQSSNVERALAGVKLLLVEDDMRTLYAVSALLRTKGAEVLVADSGSEALTLLAQHSDIEGVLMDIMLPEMDGYEVIRHMRADARLASLPVVALTAKAVAGERERCLSAGANDYLPKPVDGDELLSILHRWLKVDGGRGNVQALVGVDR